MQLVVVAGGLGTRLRPLTHARPKALVPLLNRPLILHVLDRLPEIIDQVFVAVNYRFEDVRDFLKKQDFRQEVTVVHEAKPLGTAGAIKNVEPQLDGTFVAMNGDVVDDLDLAALVKFHRSKRPAASVTVAPVQDPSAFGVVAVDGERATRFVEKPKDSPAPSNLANVGRYVFEPEVLGFIPPNREVSLEREVFPALISRGVAVYRHDGFWSDVGTLATYLQAQGHLLASRGIESAPSADVRRAELRAPALIGDGCVVEGRVGPRVALGRGCRVGRARIEDAAVFDRVSIDDKADIARSMIGEGASIGEAAVVRGSIVAPGAHVMPRAEAIDEKVGS